MRDREASDNERASAAGDRDGAGESEAAVAASHSATPPRGRRPWWQRMLIGAAIVVLVVAALGVVLYYFGGMGSSANDPAMKQQYEQLVASGEITPVEKRFTIPIPGCTCHSTDPRLTEEHRYHHMNECMQSGCHGN